MTARFWIGKSLIISVLTAMLTSVSAYAAETATETELKNGSFEYPAVTQSQLTAASGNGLWYVKTSDALEAESGNNFYWKTTASDNKFELAINEPTDSGWKQYIPGYTKIARDGKQCTELVADEQASIYQNIVTTPGDVLSWGLSHRARSASHYKDIMALFIGPMQEEYTKAPSSNSANPKDIFMWMAQVLEDAGYFSTSDSGTNGVAVHEKSAYTIYSAKNVDATTVTSSNYTSYFSLIRTETINQEWKCWIIEDTVEGWGDHTDLYEVPEGQEATTFAFTALTGISSWGDGRIWYNEGNVLDNIKFSKAFPLRVATTGGGYGRVSASALDINGNEVKNAPVTYDADHLGTYISGTNITITATTEDEDHSFLGAYVDGIFRAANNTDYFTATENPDGTTTHTHITTLDTAKYIHLVFSREATLLYDPNGGYYNNTLATTEKGLSADDSVWRNTEDAISPDPDKIRFIGWYFARGGQQSDGSYTGALIKSDHTVEYNTSNTSNTSDDTLDVYYTNTSGASPAINPNKISAGDGVAFIAQWEYLQQVIVTTKHTNEAAYTENRDGGYVELSIEDSDNQSDGERNVYISDTRSEGFGRLKDNITMTAVSDESYVFMGWYDENGNVISHGNTYRYSVSEPKTIYARFSADVVYPYLSFISESWPVKTSDATFRRGSHVKVGEDLVWERGISDSENRIGGESVYGNTISTGFTLNSKGTADTTYTNCQWTIIIPSGGTYVKVPDSNLNTSYPFTFEEQAVLTDSNAQVNKGSIQKVSGINSEATSEVLTFFVSGGFDVFEDENPENSEFDDIISYEETVEIETYNESASLSANEQTGDVTIMLYDKLPTIITGESVVTYGIVIDNLYAPGASAAFELKTSNDSRDDNFKDISTGNENIHETTAVGYRNNANNQYSKVTPVTTEGGE